MPNILDRHLIQAFQDQSTFTKADLRSFYETFDPELKESTLKWRIYDLRNTGVIREVKRGLYTTQLLPKYQPQISEALQEILGEVQRTYDDNVQFCGWETSWLNSFSRHQASSNMIIIEIEKDLMESLFFDMKGIYDYSFYINPSKNEIRYQITEDRQPVIIKKLITRSPITTYEFDEVSYRVPTIEKMMVDLVCDEDLLYTYQGTEMLQIWEKVLENIAFDFSQMLTYAKRREKGSPIQNMLVNQIPHLVKDILDAT